MILTTLTYYFDQKFPFLLTNIFLILFYLYSILNSVSKSNISISTNLITKFEIKSISSNKIKRVVSFLFLFEAQFYLALIFTIFDFRLFVLWITWVSFIIIIQIFKLSWKLKRTIR